MKTPSFSSAPSGRILKDGDPEDGMQRVNHVSFVGDTEKAIRAIRRTVFTGEQHVDPAIDFDGQDALAMHALARVDDMPVGTGRMLGDGHIGRIAVLREYRGRGIGTQIIRALLDRARQEGLPRVYLGSQMHAVGFYEKLGFTTYGLPFMEAGIEHISMELRFG